MICTYSKTISVQLFLSFQHLGFTSPLNKQNMILGVILD